MTHQSAQTPPEIDNPTPDETQYPVRRWYRAYAAEDDQAVAAIREKYGLRTNDDAVRLALRMVAGDALKTQPVQTAARRVILRFKGRSTG